MTQTELANIALDLLGAEQITDFTDRTPVAEKIRRHWPLVRDALLRSKNWNFATRRVALSADEDNAPDFDWTYAYALPADYVKAVEFNGKQAGTGESEFEIAGRFLLSDDTTAELKYTARVETVSFWDPSFQDAFAHALAAALAPGLSTAPGLGLAMRQRAEEITVQAAGPNAVETRPRTVLAQTGSGWLNARLGGSGESAEPSTTPAAAAAAPAATTITLSGDATGSGTASIAVTLAASGVTAGAYTNANITVDEKGRVISASNGTAATPGGSTAQVQFNNAGAFGGVSGLTVDVTTGALTVSANGAASAPAVNITGVPFAGTGTTSFPLVYINETGATASTVLNTAGTLFGVNGNGTSDLINLLKDGVSQCKVGSGGIMTLANDIVTAGACIVGGTQKFMFSGRSQIFCPATGMISVDGITASYPGIKRNGAAWNFRLADDSADASITAANASLSGVTKNTPVPVASLPAAATWAGGRTFVNDSSVGHAAGLGNIVAGGGANFVPVYSDGANWRIG